jgi:hypothetical protein
MRRHGRRRGLGDVAPVYLDGPASAAGAGQSAIAIPAKPLVDDITAKATFRSTVPAGACIVRWPPSGSLITVVNLANNRSLDLHDDPGPGRRRRATW